MSDAEDLKRYRANLQDETDSAALYRVMADMETKAEIAEVYRRLAHAEESHARFWLRRIEQLAGSGWERVGGPAC